MALKDFLRSTLKLTQKAIQKPFEVGGRITGGLVTDITGSEGLGNVVKGGFTQTSGAFSGDFGKLTEGFKQGFGESTALVSDLFSSDAEDPSADLGDPFTDEGRQSANDPRRRRGGSGTILTSNSQSTSLLG